MEGWRDLGERSRLRSYSLILRLRCDCRCRGGIIPANSRCLIHETFYPAIMHDGTPVTTRRPTDPPTGGIIIEAAAGLTDWRDGPLRAAPNLPRHCGTRLIGK